MEGSPHRRPGRPDRCGTRAPRRRSVAALVALLACAPIPDPAVALDAIADGFESGALSETTWKVDSKGDCTITVTDERARSGRYSARFEAGPGARCEVVPWLGEGLLPGMKREPFGTERWYAFSVYLPADRLAHPRNEIVAQWHGSRDVFFGEQGRGPPLALRIQDEDWLISYGFDPDFASDAGYRAGLRLWSGPVERGAWTDWTFRVVWSPEEDGETDVWRNGEPIVRHRGPNAYNDLRGVYLKVGDYHPGVRRTVWIDEVSLSDTPPAPDRLPPRESAR